MANMKSDRWVFLGLIVLIVVAALAYALPDDAFRVVRIQAVNGLALMIPVWLGVALATAGLLTLCLRL